MEASKNLMGAEKMRRQRPFSENKLELIRINVKRFSRGRGMNGR
jgi:hypothetical protein